MCVHVLCLCASLCAAAVVVPAVLIYMGKQSIQFGLAHWVREHVLCMHTSTIHINNVHKFPTVRRASWREGLLSLRNDRPAARYSVMLSGAGRIRIAGKTFKVRQYMRDALSMAFAHRVPVSINNFYSGAANARALPLWAHIMCSVCALVSVIIVQTKDDGGHTTQRHNARPRRHHHTERRFAQHLYAYHLQRDISTWRTTNGHARAHSEMCTQTYTHTRIHTADFLWRDFFGGVSLGGGVERSNVFQRRWSIVNYIHKEPARFHFLRSDEF